MKQKKLEIVYSDDALVVIDKPPGLLSLPDRYDRTIPNIREMMTERFGEIFMVHRLDRDTSGVMVLGRTAESHKNLNDQFEHQQVRKIYHGIVGGIVDRDEFPIDIPIAADPKRKGLMKPTARGKDAHTIVRILEKFRIATLIECRLITGRTHQIRVHCSAIGHPLLVDPDYGKNSEFLLSSIKRKFNLAKNAEERPVIDRVTLHARSLSVTHPTTGVQMEFVSEYPRDFAAALQVLRKYAAPYSSAFGEYF